MTNNPDPSNPLARALRQLATVTKVISFYPAQHPTVVSSLEKATVFLKEALTERDNLAISVAETAFLVDGSILQAEDRVLGGFASYLSRRDISAVVFQTPVEQEALKGLLEVIALDPGTLRSRGGAAKVLSERRLGGVSITEFDTAAALRLARTNTTGEVTEDAGAAIVSWSDRLARYVTGQGGLPPGGQHLIRRIAGDAAAARELMEALQKLTASAGTERAALLGAALRRIGEEVATAEPESLPALAQNLAWALMALDPKGRTDVLGSSVPIPGANLDLAGAIRASIPEERLGELIVSMVQSEGNLNARLGSVIRKVLIDRGVTDAHKTTILDAIRTARKVEKPPADVWDSVEDLLKESQDDWISREYKGLLEMVGAGPAPLEEALRNELMALPGFSEALTPTGVRRSAWLLYGDLVTIDHEPARVWVALDQLERRAADLAPDWFADTAGVAGAVVTILASQPQPHVRDAALKTLRAIATALVRSYRGSFHRLTPDHHAALAAAFEALQEHGIDCLLGGLAEEEDWEIRRPFLGLLAARKKTAVPALVRRLNDPSWYLVRNVLLVLGDIADPSTIPAIAPALRHAEPRVRRDAAAALGRIGGPRAFALLKDCLNDPEVYEVVMRSLATIDRRRAIGTVLDMTAKVDPFGRDTRRLKEAILTLGALGGNESVPRLKSILLRGFWLPFSAGDTLRIAAARALEKIGTTTALGAVQQGTRLWRAPVRSVCAEIVGQRSTGSPAPAVH